MSNPGDALLQALGRRTRQLRTSYGLTLKELAVRSGLSARFLVQVEAGDANLSIRSLAGLADALGTTPTALLSARSDPQPPRVAALLGLRGAGKTTVGGQLARRLGAPFVELDRRVEELAGLSLEELFALHGEAYYRRLEGEALERVLAEERLTVLATGGGIVTSARSWARLRRGALTIWLRASAEDHWQRVLRQGDQRPMADNPQARAELRSLLTERERLYAGASCSVITSGRPIEEVVDEVERLVRAGGPSTVRRRNPSRRS